MRDWPLAPFAIAHRGFSPDGAENSLAAFQAALDLGCRYLETDVRATADGVAMAFHDSILDRLTNHSGPLDRLTRAELASARIVGREPIATLEDVLALDPNSFVNIDVKAASGIGPTLDAIRRTDAWKRVRLASFSHRRLLALRAAAGPQVASGLSPVEIALLKSSSARFGAGSVTRAATALADWRGRRPEAVFRPAAQVPYGLGLPVIDHRFIAESHRQGIQVHAWTVNQPSAMRRLIDLGVDAIITDRLDLALSLLRAPGSARPATPAED